MVTGQIMLRLSPTVQQNHTNYVTSYSLWNALKGSYGKATASTIFKDLKDCLSAHISLTADPNIYFNKMFGAFAQMSTVDVEVPPVVTLQVGRVVRRGRVGFAKATTRVQEFWIVVGDRGLLRDKGRH